MQSEFRQKLELSRTLFSSGDVWKGFRVARRVLPAGEYDEGYVSAHVVSVHLSPPCSIEVAPPSAAHEQHLVPPGSVNLIPAGVSYRVRSASSSEKLCVQIVPGWFDSIWVDAGMAPVSLRPRYGVEEPLLAQLVLALAEDVRAGYPAGPLYGEALGAALVARIARAHAQPRLTEPRPRPGLPQHTLRLIVEYIYSKLADNITLHALAGVAQLNVFHFIRAFKRSTGASPHQFVLSKRIERASALLEATELPVAQIALECGFSNQSHFTAAYHRATGVTPALFRRGLRGSAGRPPAPKRPAPESSATETSAPGSVSGSCGSSVVRSHGDRARSAGR